MKHIFILREDTEKELIDSIISVMKNRKYKLCFTKNIEDAKTIAKSYNDSFEVCRLYAVGGDGFVHNIVNGMIPGRNELVVIPHGTGNDLSRVLYDQKDPIEILKESLNLKARSIDVIQCNEDLYCVNVFCCGLDAEVGNIVSNKDSKLKYVPKSMHYYSAILNKIFHLKFYPTVIKKQNHILYEDDVIVCGFANGKYFGGGFLIGYEAMIDDGFIDINVVDQISKKQLPSYLTSLIKGKLDQRSKYKHFKEKEIDVFSSQYVNIDGEKYQPGHYHLKCLHNALKVVYRKKDNYGN